MTTTHYLHPSAKVLTGARLGLGWLDWLNRHRIRMVQKLLATGDTTIAEAAHRVGFSELPFFFRLFRRHIGCSPAAYRRQSIASSVASR